MPLYFRDNGQLPEGGKDPGLYFYLAQEPSFISSDPVWLSNFKHLLPKARAWVLTPNKPLRQFVDGLSRVASDTRVFLDEVFENLDPQQTEALSDWEAQFNLPNSALTEQQRRDRLQARWAAQGGQDPTYIQETLQAAGFDVYVHEWWEPTTRGDSGGSVNNDVTPVARDPNAFLTDSDLLVNKILVETNVALGDGSGDFQDGNPAAQDGSDLVQYDFQAYTLPSDPNTFPYFLYIGGETFPTLANVDATRREEFEDLCLKICPTEQWLGILVTYV